MVSSDFGQLAVNRHLIVGPDWAMAGLAMVATAALAPAAVRNSRRFISGPPRTRGATVVAHPARRPSTKLHRFPARGKRMLWPQLAHRDGSLQCIISMAIGGTADMRTPLANAQFMGKNGGQMRGAVSFRVGRDPRRLMREA